MFKRSLFLLSLLLLFGILAGAVLADESAVVDFEGLPEGAIVNSLVQGAGYSSTADFGTIGVAGSPTAAMIFDSNCVGGCSGEDPDLQSNTGNVLIVTEDFDSSDPDDRVGGTLSFDFSGTMYGAVTVDQLQVTDTERGGHIRLYNNATLLADIAMPLTADGGVAIVAVNVVDVTHMNVTFNESGSVDNIYLRMKTPPTPPPGDEGCTPGYWKNHLESWAATGYSPSDLYYNVFGVGPMITLEEAINARGGGENAFLRHSTAALLNEAHPDINYAYSGVIAIVQANYPSNDWASKFDSANNAGCYF